MEFMPFPHTIFYTIIFIININITINIIIIIIVIIISTLTFILFNSLIDTYCLWCVFK